MFIRTTYDYEGCHAVIEDEEGVTLARAYEYVKTHGAWGKCRDAAIEKARSEYALLTEFGERPEPERIDFGGGGLRAV